MKRRESRRIRGLAGGVCFLLAVLLCCPARGSGTGRYLTLMIYLCGSDLESDYGSATAELEEITRACRGNDEVTVLAMTGGSRRWTREYTGEDETGIIEIGARGARTMRRLPGMNMGNPETLTEFLRIAREERPAEQYALILWDHGAGPMEGVCFDERSGMDSLSLTELKTALENSPFSGGTKLDWIGFDACLMGSVETALVCAPYAEYMVASEETEPVSGWNYAFLADVKAGDGAEKICRSVLERYPEGKKETDLLTLSLVELGKAEAVEKAADTFFAEVLMPLTETTFSEYANARKDVKAFGQALPGSAYDLADLYGLTEKYAPAAPAQAEDLKRAIRDAVRMHVGNQKGAEGLSVYFPHDNRKAYTEEWSGRYDGFGVLKSYERFMTRYGAIWTGEQLARWDHLHGTARPRTAEGIQTMEITLTDEQVTHLANAYTLILEDAGSETAFTNTFLVDRIRMDGNTLRADYGFECLYAVDEQGRIQTEPIGFQVLGEYYFVFAFLETQSVLADPAAERLSVALICGKNEETGELEIRNMVPVSEEPDELIFGRREIDLQPEKYPYIRFSSYAYEMKTDGEGSLLPFSQWPGAESNIICFDAVNDSRERIPMYVWQQMYDTLPEGYRQETEADNRKPWKLKFCPRKSSGRDLKAQFILIDSQHNEWGSDLIPLDPPDVTGTAKAEGGEMEISGCLIRPKEIKTIRNDTFEGICLRMEAENKTDENRTLLLLNPLINGVMSSYRSEVIGNRQINPREKCIVDFLFGEEYLPFAGDSRIRSVSFIPLIVQTGFEMEDFNRRMTVETEADVSGFRLRERPGGGGEPLGTIETDWGTTFELVRLEEAEQALLTGTMHITSRLEKPLWFMFATARGDDRCIGWLNGSFAGNFATVPENLFYIPAGGEGYIDFTLHAGAGRKVPVLSGMSLEDEEVITTAQTVTEIRDLGFVATVMGERMSLDEASYQLFSFVLEEPFPLGEPVELYVP